jgi:hypothetical protein
MKILRLIIEHALLPIRPMSQRVTLSFSAAQVMAGMTKPSRCAVTRRTYSAITVLFVGLSRLLEVFFRPPRKGPFFRWFERNQHWCVWDISMTADLLVGLYICAISITGSCLFLVVHQLEPNRRFAVILKGAILAAGGVAIVSHLP